MLLQREKLPLVMASSNRSSKFSTPYNNNFQRFQHMKSCHLSQHEERYKLGCNLHQVISCSSSALQITTTGALLNCFPGLVYFTNGDSNSNFYRQSIFSTLGGRKQRFIHGKFSHNTKQFTVVTILFHKYTNIKQFTVVTILFYKYINIKYFTVVTILFHKCTKYKLMTAILICNFKSYILQMNCSSDKQETEKLRQQLREVQQTLSAFRQRMGTRRSPTSARSTTSRCTVRSTGTSVWSPSSEYSNTSSPSTSINDIATTLSFSCQLSDSDYTLSSRGNMTQPDGCSDCSSLDDTMDYDDNCTSKGDMTQTFVSDYVSLMMFGESRQADMESNSSYPQQYSDNSCFPSSSSSSSDNMVPVLSSSCQLSDSNYTFSSQGDTTLPEPANMTETFVSNCVSKLTYGDLCECSLESHEGNTSCNKSKEDSTLDSDTSAFMELPLCRRPVTHKSTKHRSMAKHLKQVGKQIRKQGLHNLMDTLAIL